jgi:thiol peroxidase
MRGKRKRYVLLIITAAAVIFALPAYSPCQVPNGNYEDSTKFDQIAENIAAIEKIMRQIKELTAQHSKNVNQLVQLAMDKEKHADEIGRIVTFYFMAQRIKPPAEADINDSYVKKLAVLHEILVSSMKTKQTSNIANVEKLRSLLEQFRTIYSGKTVTNESGRGPGEWNTIMKETRTVTAKGKPLMLVGTPVKVGEPAPDFEVIANDMSPVRLSSFRGKICLITSVPSLYTSVCDIETRKFNEQAGKFGDKVAVLTISMDLPFAQKRWCEAASVKNLQTLSDYRKAEFGLAFGVLIEETRLLARAVFIVDAEGTIRYIQIVDELSHEPNYDEAIKALKGIEG